MQGGGSATSLPLESTDVDVQVTGVLAAVTVKQTYRNAGSRPIEATYVFPASTRAAVHGLRMRLGNRVVEAVIKEREEARRTYEAAKTAGRAASLLEQQRPNVFQMNVANILPGERIGVELRYTELLVPEGGVYELVYPTVVGPRYSEQPAAGAPPAHAWVANPYLRDEEPGGTSFRLAATLDTGLPLQDVGSPSHAVHVSYPTPSRAAVRIDARDTEPANRDFVLRFRLQDARIETGLLLEGEGDERFFLLMVQPPERVTAALVPPRDYVFVLDVSGSMNGFPLDVAKKLMTGLLQTLRPQDRFNVLLFAGASDVLSETSLPATPGNVRAALETIDAHRGSGGTRLLPALDRAFSLPAPAGLARSVVVVTDGYIDVEAEAFDRVRAHAGDTSVYAFGIGSAVNRHLVEGLARAGHGEPFVVTGTAEADAAVRRFQNYVAAPLLTNVTVDYGALDVYDVEPAVIPVLTSERPLVVTGKWRGRAGGQVGVRGQQGETPWSATLVVPAPAKATALRTLWARERLRRLSDLGGAIESAEQRRQIVDLGLRFDLLTKHTSFVAVDREVRTTSGQPDTVQQPLPLPQGVSELAVGASAPGTPEPATLLLLGIAGGAAARRLRRRNRA